MPERWEEEIDELLKRREARLRPEPLGRRISRSTGPATSGIGRVLRVIGDRPLVEQIMIASIALVAISSLMQLVGLAGPVSFWAGVASLVLFVLALVLSFRGHQRAADQRANWRGQELYYLQRRPSLWASLQAWYRRKRGGRRR
ncbi:MAG: hypothetical protein U0821_03325 [Chloroflexota bacterium]